MLKKYLNKENLHHAYLIEGNKNDILPLLFSFLEEINVGTIANPDFYNISVDTFKMEDAENFKSSANQKSFSNDLNTKRIFIVSANNFLHNAQNTLLKIFEEPKINTHFFLITPDKEVFLPTILSRTYFISLKSETGDEIKEADKFIKMNLSARLEYIKELVKGKDEEEEPHPDPLLKGEGVNTDSPRAKALKFLSALEVIISNTKEPHPDPLLSKEREKVIEQIFSVREYLRQPGSSTKMLMESIAILL
ncbi:MAG: hypothetical protein NT068_01645 [Candidatus Nomurabacteria bacterium]|nr:hypothetical protein [Candidatus Nomurabacteria bacterium]